MDFSISQQSARKPKRVRSAFTTLQINFLEEQFKKSPYISSEHRKQLAFVLKIQERAIKIWFQNRRMREKKDLIKDDDERNKNEESQRQLNNECATPSANDRPSLPIITEPVVVRSANVDDTISVKPKAKTNTVLSHFFEPSVNVDDKPVTVEQKTKTTVLSHFFEPSVNVDHRPTTVKPEPKTTVVSHFFEPSANVEDKPSVSAKPKAKSHTVLSKFFEQYKYCSAPLLRKPTVTNTTNKSAVSIPKKYSPVLTDGNTTGNYNLSTKALQNFARKNLCSKVKSRSNISQSISTPKTRKLPRSCVKTTKTANIRKPAFVPVMQTMYSPIPSPSSVVWKPVNILPAPGTSLNTYGLPQGPLSQQKKCCCMCTQSHSSSPVFGRGVNINNSPYQQYVLALPFQNHGPSF